MARPARWKLAAIACGLALLAAACGSGGGTSSGGTPAGGPSSAAPATSAPNAALCADAAALRASLDKLTHVKVTRDTSGITADINEVMANLTAFANQAHGQWQGQTSALKSALATLKTATSNLAAHPGASTVAGVRAALGGVRTSGQNLLAAAHTRCPSVSPSPTT
jgi:hypothetical protein